MHLVRHVSGAVCCKDSNTKYNQISHLFQVIILILTSPNHMCMSIPYLTKKKIYIQPIFPGAGIREQSLLPLTTYLVAQILQNAQWSTKLPRHQKEGHPCI